MFQLDLARVISSFTGVKIRILVSLHNAKPEDAVQKLIEENPGIDIRDIKKPLQTKLTNLLVDKASSLTVELKDDSNEDPSEAMGLATYSNSEATVFSYVSIFENLWIKTQLHKTGRQEKEVGASRISHF